MIYTAGHTRIFRVIREDRVKKESKNPGPASSVPHESSTFQPDSETIRWKIHFRSSPADVYLALASPEGRRGYWAESADEENGVIHFIVPGGLASKGRILERIQNKTFTTEYFNMKVRFNLESDSSGTGTDLEMTCTDYPPHERIEIIAGWVSVLMSMKAAVDFNADLRNHNPHRSWWQGYADN